MKLCSRLLMGFGRNFCEKRQTWVSEHYSGEVRNDARPWLMAHQKAHGQLSIRVNWTSFCCLLRFRSYEAKCVQLGCFRRGSTYLHSNFTWTGLSQSAILGNRKLETLGYLMVKTISLCVPSFWHNTGMWRTDRQTDGQTDEFAVAHTALPKLALWRAVKTNPRYEGIGCWWYYYYYYYSRLLRCLTYCSTWHMLKWND